MKIFRFVFLLPVCLFFTTAAKQAAPDMTMEEALRAGNKKAVAYYLKHGDGTIQSPNAKRIASYMANRKTNSGMPFLALAAKQGNASIVKRLIKAGADINAPTRTGLTPLMLATFHDHLKAVKVLLAAGADVEAREKNGVTALMVAHRGCPQITKLLLKAGADIHAKERIGSDALMFAIIEENTSVIKLLLAAEPDIHTKHIHRHLLMAIVGDKKEAVKALFEGGVSPNADDGVFTALDVAAMQGNSEMVKLLLASGADVNLKNPRGETALSLAIKRNVPDIAKILKAAGGVK